MSIIIATLLEENVEFQRRIEQLERELAIAKGQYQDFGHGHRAVSEALERRDG